MKAKLRELAERNILPSTYGACNERYLGRREGCNALAHELLAILDAEGDGVVSKPADSGRVTREMVETYDRANSKVCFEMNTHARNVKAIEAGLHAALAAQGQEGPEEEDGPWAEGWEERSGQTVARAAAVMEQFLEIHDVDLNAWDRAAFLRAVERTVSAASPTWAPEKERP